MIQDVFLLKAKVLGEVTVETKADGAVLQTYCINAPVVPTTPSWASSRVGSCTKLKYSREHNRFPVFSL